MAVKTAQRGQFGFGEIAALRQDGVKDGGGVPLAQDEPVPVFPLWVGAAF